MEGDLAACPPIEGAVAENRCALHVTGLPGDTDEDDLADYFEHNRRGGFRVEKVELLPETSSALVYFESPEVVEKVLQKTPFKINKKQVEARPHAPATIAEPEEDEVVEEVQKRTSSKVDKKQVEARPHSPATTAEPAKDEDNEVVLEVSGIPENVGEEDVADFFENKKRGGFEVKKVEIDEETQTALVFFENPGAAEVVKMAPFIMNKTTISVKLFVPEEDIDPRFVLHVLGLPEFVDEEDVTDYFEHRKRGGFTPSRVELDENSKSAKVHFEDASAVEAILQKAPFKMREKQLEVKPYVPPKKKDYSRMLLVRNLPSNADEMTVTDFFESGRRGGYNVEQVELFPSQSSAVVYFKQPEAISFFLNETWKMMDNELDVSRCPRNALKKLTQRADSTVEEKIEEEPLPKVAKQVCKKTDHVLSGHNPEVSLQGAQAAGPDRVFLTGLPDLVSKESLTNFLVAWTKLKPMYTSFGEEEGTALVVFNSVIDMVSLEKALQENKLEGNEVKAQPVAPSNKVLVRGEGPTVTQQNLELYFENARTSGGGELLGVEKQGEGAWLVSFAQQEVADRVCKRSHLMQKVVLEVSPHLDCLGLGGGDPDPRSFSVPPPLAIPIPHPLLLHFLGKSLPQRKVLKELTGRHHALANLEDQEGTQLTLTCSLTRETPRGKRLAKTWTDDVKTAVGHFLDTFEFEKIRMSPAVFEEVAKHLHRLQQAEDNVLIDTKGGSTILVIGCPPAVRNTVSSINTVKKQHEAELEKKSQTVEDCDDARKPHELEYLIAIDFPGKAMAKAQGIDVAIDRRERKVKFKGLIQHVKSAQIEMLSIVASLQCERVELSPSKESSYKSEKVQKFIRSQMESRRMVPMLELAEGKLKVWAATDQDLVTATHIVTDAVQEETHKLDPESIALLSGKAWDLLKKGQEGQDGVTIITENKTRGEITVTSLKESLAQAVESLTNFFNEFTLYKQQLRFPPGRQRFLTEHLASKIQDLQHENRAYHVRITTDKEIKLEGNKIGLARTTTTILAMGASIKSKPHIVDDKAQITFLNSSRGKDALVLAEKNTRCVIQETDDETDKPTMQKIVARPEMVADGYQIVPGVTLIVMKDDITAMKVGAIVNAANENLQHHGGLAKDISQKAGSRLQKECDAFISRHGRLQEGGVWVSGAGSLPCQHVIHAVGPRYQRGLSKEEDRLKKAVTGSLEAAHKLRLASLAIPAISTGIFCYPVNEATRVIVEAIVEYFRSHLSSSLREVYLVNKQPEIVQHFHSAAAKLLTRVNAEAHAQKTSTETHQPTRKPLATGSDSIAARMARGRPMLDFPVPVNSGSGTGLQVVEGELADQQVDVLVNTTSPTLQLNQGAVSQSLLREGGPTLQREINQNYPDGLPTDKLFVSTSAGRLQAKRIFHTALPKWKQNGEQFLLKLLETCVREADSRGFSSIAFPALGTGVLQYPRDVVVRCFQDVASTLLPRCRSLQEIRVVLFPSDLASIKAFGVVMQTRQGGATLSRGPFQLSQTLQSPAIATDGEAEIHFAIKDIIIVVKQGNILSEKVDIIVNSSNSSLDLSRGAVAQAILQACGPDLQAECNNPHNLKKLQKSGVVMTPCKGLRCSSILHVDADKFQGNWKGAIIKCLQKAAKQKVSIAFPALGTGVRQQSSADAATAFVEAFMQMAKDNLGVSLRDVRIVIFQEDIFQTFVKAMKTLLETSETKKVGWMESAMRKVASWVGGKTKEQSAGKADSIVLYLFSDDDKEIQRAIDIITEKFHAEHQERTFKEDIIKTLSPEQCKELEKLRVQYSVDVHIDQIKGEVCIKGQSGNFLEATHEMHELLRNFVREHQEASAAEMVSSFVEWGFLDPSGHVQLFDIKTGASIEKAFKNQETSFSFTENLVRKVLEFDKMEMYTATHVNDKVKVIRRGAELSPPQHWSPMADNEIVKLVTLSRSDQEYKDTEALFRKTLGQLNVAIVQIQRVQSRTLYSQYETKKQAMEKQVTSGNPVERRLWHGTARNAIASINEYGFNRSYCGKNATAFGDGVYFAVNSNYSAQGKFSPADNNGLRYMYLTRVLTGDFTQGKEKMKVPPAKHGHILYDSLVNDLNNPIMFIVFNDTQAYPEFLITFM